MTVIGRPRRRTRPAFWTACVLLALLRGPGGMTPYFARTPRARAQTPPHGKGPDRSETILVDSPRGSADPDLHSPGTGVETWVVHTRAFEQILGTNPWTGLTVARLDEHGGPLHGAEPEEFLERMAGRPVVIPIHGNGYGYRDSIKEAIEVRAKLEALGGLTPGSLFVIYDWPSERSLRDIVVDLNEKARRSGVASYHLARILQASPPGSRICLMGQSDGGRIVLTTSHLLSGAELPRFLREPPAQLSSGRRDLRPRCITLDAAAAHQWLDPGQRLEQTLPTCEAPLNLPNRRDYALAVYTFGRYTGTGGAIGRVGLGYFDRRRLGPLMDKVEEIDHHDESGIRHTLFPQALTYPVIAGRIAAYTSRGDIEPGKVTRRGKHHALPEAPAGGLP